MNTEELQSAADILMIRPVRFGGNPETLASNRFQAAQPGLADPAAQRAAAAEFDRLVAALGEAGVNVHVDRKSVV